MNYPFWDIPIFGSGWVIGGIAIFHVMISHFAVGGGFYLPMAERRALRANRPEWLELVKNHARFFMILTLVFGAVSGVAIWFAIGLANPEGTSTLIHNFVFGWAIEWCFFIVEITAALVYYYTWGRISDRLHLIIGWIYAGSAFASLVIINGILTFMLTPGDTWLGLAGTGEEASGFWYAFFNPTYWPSLVLRTLVCLSLAGVWALISASRVDGKKRGHLKTDMIRWSTRWLVPSFFLMPLMLWWYYASVPDSALNLIEKGYVSVAGGFSQVTRMGLVTVMSSGTILLVIGLFVLRRPREFGFGQAILVLLLALAATGSAESAREMLRKPYVIHSHMFSNGVRTSEIAAFNEHGYLKRKVGEDEAGAPILEDVVWARGADFARRGELMLAGQCKACHTENGYRALEKFYERQILAAADAGGSEPAGGGRKVSPQVPAPVAKSTEYLVIRGNLDILSETGMLLPPERNEEGEEIERKPRTYPFMPPLVGTQEEKDALALAIYNFVVKKKPLETAEAGQ